MNMKPTTLLILASLAFCAANPATATDLLIPTSDAPRYVLSNLRSEDDVLGRPGIAVDFKRVREGKGTVSVRGRSVKGPR